MLPWGIRFFLSLGSQRKPLLMLAKLNTLAQVGIDAVPVEVEVDAAA
jgi:hypothetical protein